MRSLESNDSMFRHFCLRKLWLVTNKSSSLIWRDLAKDSYIEKSPLLYQRSLFKDEFFLAKKSLKDNGYYVFKNRLKQDLIDNFVSLSDTLGFLAEDSRQQVSEEITFGQIQNGKSLRYIYNNNVFKHILVDNLLSDSVLVSLIEDYLKTNQITIYGKGWKSVGRSNITLNQASNAAQMFHFDYDSMNFLKIFVYLSDVTEHSGPHEFISGSNKPYSTNLMSNNIKPYGRYTDQSMFKIFRKNATRFTGLKGTVIIEDTSGFHKGNILTLESLEIS